MRSPRRLDALGRTGRKGDEVLLVGALSSLSVAAGPDVHVLGDTETSRNLVVIGTLRVPAGATLLVHGDLELQAGSTLHNAGTVLHCGTRSGTGTVTGTQPQTVTCP